MDFSILKNKLEQLGTDFVCPVCHSEFSVSDHLIRCVSGHTFNFTKPGTINFISRKINRHDLAHYETEKAIHALKPWQKVIEMLKKEAGLQTKDSRICLTGSSLGPFLNEEAAGFEAVGFEAVGFEAAAVSVVSQLRQFPSLKLFLAEASRLPLADASMALVLRLDDHRDMAESLRILKAGHSLIRILPGPRHLLELRQHLYSGRRMGLRENQPLLKAIWALHTEANPVRSEHLTFSMVPTDADKELLIQSLEPDTDPEVKMKIKSQVTAVSFDFMVYRFKKPDSNSVSNPVL